MVSFRKLFSSSIPEILFFQVVASLILAVPAAFLVWLMNLIASSTGDAITTADLKGFILSWRFPVILVIGFILIAFFIILEIFAQIHLCDDILEGKPVRVIDELKKSFRSFSRFLNPSGIGIIIFIFILVPICGIGFSISLTQAFHIPNFIMDFIMGKPFLAAGYTALIIVLIIVAIRFIFTLHEVRLDDMHPKEARKKSAALVKENRKTFLLGMLKAILISALVMGAAYLVLRWLPEVILNRIAQGLSAGNQAADAVGREVSSFRIACVVYMTLGSYLYGIVTLLSGSYLLFRLTYYYKMFTKGPQELFKARPKREVRAAKGLFLLLIIVLILAGSFYVGMHFDDIIKRDGTVGIVAHRAGGTMATENTVLGVEKAIEHGCVGSEIDIHRTKDGYYVVNHDNDFSRVAGVDKAPKDMTLEEVKELKVKDAYTVGDGDPVATLEEMLDAVKGTGTKLFIELKGDTADRQMVDDTVAMVREKDCVKDVMLISLLYDLIDYAETEYPEFETGVLFFAGLGDFTKLNCDVLILEEQMASAANVQELRNAGKGVIVWTVNTEDSMKRFLDSRIDAIITDNVELAEQVQEQLDQRNDFEIIRDWVNVTLSI